MELVATARSAEVARIHITAFGRAGTIPILNISTWNGRHANRKTHQFRARDTDARGHTLANINTGSNTNTDSNPYTGSCPPDV